MQCGKRDEREGTILYEDTHVCMKRKDRRRASQSQSDLASRVRTRRTYLEVFLACLAIRAEVAVHVCMRCTASLALGRHSSSKKGRKTTRNVRRKEAKKTRG